MNIDEITIGQAKQLVAMLGLCAEAQKSPWEIGKSYFFRTVTHHDVGRVVAVYSDIVVLEDAAWVADDGRFSEALATGKLNEVEPFPPGRVFVGRGSIIDCAEWPHSLPRAVK